MQKWTIKTLFILGVLVIGGCDKVSQKAPTNADITENAQEVVDKKTNPTEALQKSIKPEEHENSASSDPEGLYAGMPATDFVYPILSQKAVPYHEDSEREYADGTLVGKVYTYGDVDFLDSYTKQIKAAGFQMPSPSSLCFVKQLNHNSPRIIHVEQGDGELVIEMLLTADPQERYAGLPDARLPYPLENACLAAEYASVELPSEASASTTYSYYNWSPTQLKDYENLLISRGFSNVRIPESPLYTKSLDDNVELSVAIESTGDSTLDVRLIMTATPLGEN